MQQISIVAEHERAASMANSPDSSSRVTVAVRLGARRRAAGRGDRARRHRAHAATRNGDLVVDGSPTRQQRCRARTAWRARRRSRASRKEHEQTLLGVAVDGARVSVCGASSAATFSRIACRDELAVVRRKARARSPSRASPSAGRSACPRLRARMETRPPSRRRRWTDGATGDAVVSSARPAGAASRRRSARVSSPRSRHREPGAARAAPSYAGTRASGEDATFRWREHGPARGSTCGAGDAVLLRRVRPRSGRGARSEIRRRGGAIPRSGTHGSRARARRC